MLDLSNNQIKELPREEMQHFLEQGGTFQYESNIAPAGGISLRYNPLQYPPKHVYDKGEKEVLSYVTTYANSMVDPDDIPLLMMGKQGAGKTSIGHVMAGKISSAKEIKPEDRTQVFDYYKVTVEKLIFGIIDLGGHEEYACSLPLFCRQNGLQASVIQPTDVDSVENLDDALGSYIHKVMNGAVQPNILLIVSRTDEMKEKDKDKESRIAVMKTILRRYLSTKRGEVMAIREKRLQELKGNLKSVEQELEIADLDQSDLANLQRKKSSLMDAIGKQTFKVNHPPNFNEDCITFVSSVSQEGFQTLRKNLMTSVSRLPKVKLQKHWADATRKLLSKEDAYITVDDFVEESGLDKSDLIQMLEALSAQGRIVLAGMAGGNYVIFPHLNKLADLMKSIFFHEMADIIIAFAKHEGKDPDALLAGYLQGKLPVKLIQALFSHICSQPKGLDKKIRIDYTNFLSSPPDPNQRIAITSFLHKLQDLNILRILEEEENGLKVCLVPHLISHESIPERLSWIEKYSSPSPCFSITALRPFESNVSDSTFATCHASLRGAIDDLSKLIDTKKVYHIHKYAMVACVSDYEIVLQKTQKAISLQVNLLDNSILPGSVWILLNDLVPRLGLEDEFWRLICPLKKNEEICNHGQFYSNPKYLVSPSLESVKGNIRYREQIQCSHSVDISCCFPSEMANGVMRLLHPEGEEEPSLSPLVENAEKTIPLADYLETQNLVAVLLTEPISDQSDIKLHPAFLTGEHKFFGCILPVRKHFDNLTICKSDNHSKCKPEECKRNMSQYEHDIKMVEKNGPIVTTCQSSELKPQPSTCNPQERGDWSKTMTKLVKKYKSGQSFSEGNHSVADLTRALRNICGHDSDLSLLAEARTHFAWIIMHDFSFWAKYIRKNPTLMKFAKKFFAFETRRYQELLMVGNLEVCPHPFVKVKVMKAGNFVEETRCFRSKPKPQVKGAKVQKPKEHQQNLAQTLFLNEVRRTIPLSSEIEWEIVYKGVETEGSEPAHTPDAATEITGDDALRQLDNDATHLIQIQPHALFQVKVFKDGSDQETSFYFDVKRNPSEVVAMVEKKIPLPKEKKWNIVYEGIVEKGKDPPLAKGTELNADNLRKLDYTATHNIYMHTFPFFKVTVQHEKSEEICLYFDSQKTTNKFLADIKEKQKQDQKPPIPEGSWLIFYQGVEGTANDPPLPPGTELKGNKCLQQLDNTTTHLIHLSPLPLFKVEVFKTESRPQSTRFYFDVRRAPKRFLAAVQKKIPISNESEWKIVYKGVEEADCDPPIDADTLMDEDNSFKMLDSTATHLFHVLEE